MKIFLENEGKTVAATIDGKDYSYRAGKLTHFGSEQAVGSLVDLARTYLTELVKESREAGKNEILVTRAHGLHAWAITTRAAPVLAADIDGVFQDYEQIFELMNSVEGDRFIDDCAETALLLNPQLNPERAELYQSRRDREAKRQADFLARSKSAESSPTDQSQPAA